MEIGKVIEIGERVIEVPQLTPAKEAPNPQRSPSPERVKEPERVGG